MTSKFRFTVGLCVLAFTVGRERVTYPFHEALTYFVKATWRGGVFNVLIKEGGVNGDTIYDFGKSCDGTYQPFPHNVYIGSPYKPGDRGEPSGLADMIIDRSGCLRTRGRAERTSSQPKGGSS